MIIKYIKDNSIITPKEVREYISICGPMIHRYLKKLLEEKVIEKRAQLQKYTTYLR